MRTFRSVLVVSGLLLSACHSFNADVKIFCSASTENPGAAFPALAQWTSERTHNDEFRALFTRVAEAGDMPRFFQELDGAVARAGLTSCPTLETLKAPNKPAGDPK